VIAFQDAFGLRADGIVDDVVWSTLIEASWALGSRVIYLRTPNLRGDDVAELQAVLNRLGFDCGRVDGIFGPATQNALTEFQRNIGADENGICTPDTVGILLRVSSQSGSGPGIAVVREREELSDSTPEKTARVVIGGFEGVTDLVRAAQHRAAAVFPLATTVEGDVLTQAQTANRYGADVYVGFENAAQESCTVYFYEVPTFVSTGGRALAERIVATITDRIPELTVRAEGVRHPVLRETRMPAVLCSMGPSVLVRLKTVAVANAVVSSLRDWLAAPLENS
jgi:N-acetylmuramoyl-L-alanine amidase